MWHFVKFYNIPNANFRSGAYSRWKVIFFLHRNIRNCKFVAVENFFLSRKTTFSAVNGHFFFVWYQTHDESEISLRAHFWKVNPKKRLLGMLFQKNLVKKKFVKNKKVFCNTIKQEKKTYILKNLVLEKKSETLLLRMHITIFHIKISYHIHTCNIFLIRNWNLVPHPRPWHLRFHNNWEHTQLLCFCLYCLAVVLLDFVNPMARM